MVLDFTRQFVGTVVESRAAVGKEALYTKIYKCGLEASRPSIKDSVSNRLIEYSLMSGLQENAITRNSAVNSTNELN